MRAVERRRGDERQTERRAKPARRSIALNSPRPPLLKGPTKESVTAETKPRTPTKPADGDCVAATSGSVADAFFGASPVVASALGIRSGATPRGPHQPTTASPSRLSKQDISTLLGVGHFYFALTGSVHQKNPRSGHAVRTAWSATPGSEPGGRRDTEGAADRKSGLETSGVR